MLQVAWCVWLCVAELVEMLFGGRLVCDPKNLCWIEVRISSWDDEHVWGDDVRIFPHAADQHSYWLATEVGNFPLTGCSAAMQPVARLLWTPVTFTVSFITLNRNMFVWQGTSKMVLESGKHPAQLKDMVCSPGGTTINGVHQLEKSGCRAALMDAVEAATNQAKYLSRHGDS